jgi:NTP pyrophosphatase (non-canonical NTP hydrolase)
VTNFINRHLTELATFIVEQARLVNAGGTPEAAWMALAEETGEFIGAMRRWRGLARRNGTEREAQDELADVIISAYCVASVMGWDADEIVTRKLEKTMTRGWKESADD